jgi:SNF2 family DNA or RNA helicase
LKVGILAGSDIFGAKGMNLNRGKTVAALNDGDLDGIIMTDKVGGTGFSLVGANHMIFLGSLYSQDDEDQAIGTAFETSIH